MKNVTLVVLGIFTGVIFAGLQTAAFGQTRSQGSELASISAEGMTVRWESVIPSASVVLAVSGPDGNVFRQEFEGGVAPSFSLLDKTGGALRDGQYTYELTFTPLLTQEVKERLIAARTEGNDDSVQRELRSRGQLPAQPLVQSGSFVFQNGFVYVGNEIEPNSSGTPRSKPSSKNNLQSNTNRPTEITPEDLVIPDDLIVQGSGCVGLDCVDGEVFGFDTFRLKENNTRIQFDDTSNSAGFATNNWQIRANSSASGGDSFLGFVDQGATGNSETGTIVFQVDAGAPANSLRVSNTGKIGIKTATPVLDLHMNNSDTPAARLEQTASGGFTAQTWDIAGNEANFFVRDVTGGSRLPFRIRPGAPTSSIDINASGNVGVGTASASSRLTLKNGTANADAFILQRSQADSQTIFRIFETTAGAGLFSVFDDTGLEATRFTSVSGGKLAIGCNAPDHRLDLGNGTGVACSSSATRSFIDAGSTTFTASSSRSLKENLEPVQVPNILDKIAHVAVYNYDFINGPKDKIGLMAEDFHTVLGHGSDKLINGQEVEMTLWLAVQELTTRNKELAAENGDLAKRLARLEALVAGSAARQ